jgi:peptide/nickel transport system permease protein
MGESHDRSYLNLILTSALGDHSKAGRRGLRAIGRALWGNKTAAVSGVIVLILIFCAIFAPLISPHDPLRQNPKDRLLPPVFMEGGSWEHVLGTDGNGRDLFSRILYGLGISLVLSVSAVLIALCVGVTIGMIAGFFGGVIDTVLMRLVDVQLAFPYVVLAVAILSLARPTISTLAIVLSLATWAFYARVIRSSVLTQRHADYITAARVAGVGNRGILWLIFRNLIPPFAVVLTMDVATMIIWEALLGFIGLGVQPPTPSWGNIMADGKNYIVTAWWIATLPGIAIFITLFSINLLGDSLQKWLDPRLR